MTALENIAKLTLTFWCNIKLSKETWSHTSALYEWLLAKWNLAMIGLSLFPYSVKIKNNIFSKSQSHTSGKEIFLKIPFYGRNISLGYTIRTSFWKCLLIIQNKHEMSPSFTDFLIVINWLRCIRKIGCLTSFPSYQFRSPIIIARTNFKVPCKMHSSVLNILEERAGHFIDKNYCFWSSLFFLRNSTAYDLFQHAKKNTVIKFHFVIYVCPFNSFIILNKLKHYASLCYLWTYFLMFNMC